MAKTGKKYYGIQDSQIDQLPVSEEDREFISTSLSRADMREAWSTYHDDDHVNAKQGVALAQNMIDAQQELVDEVLTRRLGRNPPDHVRGRNLKIRGKKGSVIRWIYWKSKPVTLITLPITYVKNSRYFLRWYWKEVKK